MKPFLGIDLTNNKKNEQSNGEMFLVAKPSLALQQSLERSSKNAEETIEKSKLPLPIRIGQWICGAVGSVVLFGIIQSLYGEDKVSLKEAYQNAGWLFWLAGACLVCWAILKALSARKEKSVLGADESSMVFDNLGKTCEAILSDLAVPAEAKQMNVLFFFYKIKKENIKVCEKGLQIAPYFNPVFHAFADSENLYLANLDGKYAIPLSAMKAIRSVKKSIRMTSWNKDDPYDGELYVKYKLIQDEYGGITCKCYHILEFEHNNELWGIYFPCYELPLIEELTGLKADAF